MQLRGQIHVNDLDLTGGGKGLLVASNIGIQMWSVAGFNESPAKVGKSEIIPKKMESQKLKNKNLKNQKVKLVLQRPKQLFKAKKAKKVLKKQGKLLSKSETLTNEKNKMTNLLQVEKMQKSGNPKLNFSTKYNFNFKTKEQEQKNTPQIALKPETSLKKPVLVQTPANEPKRQQDKQVKYSFPLQSNKENQKSTMNYLKAEHRVTGFEKNICEINGRNNDRLDVQTLQENERELGIDAKRFAKAEDAAAESVKYAFENFVRLERSIELERRFLRQRSRFGEHRKVH